MTLIQIRFGNVFRFISLILAVQFVMFPSYVYGDTAIQTEAGNYQPVISVSESSASGAGASDELPNPNQETSPLSFSSENPPAMLSFASSPPIVGSIVIGTGGSYSNGVPATLNLAVSGGDLPGDRNADGKVDSADYVMWRKQAGSQAAYDEWRQNFGRMHGVTEMIFSTTSDFSSSVWEPYQMTRDWAFSGSPGNRTIFVKFRDGLNNESPVYSKSVYWDAVSPSLSNINILGVVGGQYVLSATVQMQMFASDTGSGLSKMRFSEDGGNTWTNWENYASFKSYTFSDQTNGPRTIKGQVMDLAGNESAIITKSIYLDTVRPDFYFQPGAVFTGNKGVRKVIMLGPLTDQEGNAMSYNFFPNVFDSHGSFTRVLNQLTFIPSALEPNFTGEGDITIQANDSVTGESSTRVLHLVIKEPTFNYSDDPSSTYQLSKVDAIRAWNLSRGTDVKVAVLDTGLDMDHPDLNGNIDYANAKDFVDGDNDPSPSVGPGNEHGTHVAGIVAAENNGQGTVGIAPEAKIVPIRVGNPNALVTNVIQGINYAVSVGAKIINISFAGLISALGSEATNLQNAINAAFQAGAVIVAAAGNNGNDPNPALHNSGLYAPAGQSHVISVSSTDSSDARSSFSNIFADLSAPGSNISSTVPNDTYTTISGTSMSSPLVAGLIALMRAQDPTITEQQIMLRLQLSSKDLGTPGQDSQFGLGRIDAFKALSYDYWSSLGVIKTLYLEEPDENNFIQLNFDINGYFTGGLEAGSGGSMGFGVLGAGTLTSSFSESIEADSYVEAMPRLTASPRLSVSSVLASASSSSFTPLIWDAFKSRHSGYSEVLDKHKNKENSILRFTKPKKGTRRV